MVDSIATFDQKVIYSLSINIPIIIPLMLNHVMTVHQPMDPYGVVQSVGGGAIEAMGRECGQRPQGPQRLMVHGGTLFLANSICLCLTLLLWCWEGGVNRNLFLAAAVSSLSGYVPGLRGSTYVPNILSFDGKHTMQFFGGENLVGKA